MKRIPNNNNNNNNNNIIISIYIDKIIELYKKLMMCKYCNKKLLIDKSQTFSMLL